MAKAKACVRFEYFAVCYCHLIQEIIRLFPKIDRLSN